MFIHNKYTNFTSEINSNEKESSVTDNSENTTTVDPVKVPEPVKEEVLTPISTSGTTIPNASPFKEVNSVDPDLTTLKHMQDAFLNYYSKSPILSKKDKERAAYALLRLVQFALSKDKRVLYDNMYKFIKDHRNTNLNPVNVFEGGDEKMKRAEIGELTLFIAAFCRVQDGNGVDFKELERALPKHPLLITFLSEKIERKNK
jgi:hypothetical protein